MSALFISRLRRLFVAFPVQTIFVIILFKQRSKGVQVTDARICLISDVHISLTSFPDVLYVYTIVVWALHGIRLIKAYAWESFCSGQLGSLRTRENKTVKTGPRVS